MASGDLITRNYANFRGVDFTDEEVALTRSPDSLNMWKDYSKLGKSVETRPDIELVESFDNTIFGLFFYKVGNTEMMLVHCGTTLYKIANGTREILYTGLNPRKSNAFIYNNIWYFKDGINYLEYNGETIGEVVGYIPTTSISRKPNGGGTIYEDVNMLTGIRKNTFVADGESTEYYLDAQNIDTNFQPIVLVNDKQVTDFTVDTTKGMIKFAVAPTKPLTDGRDNVSITFRRTVSDYRDRINKCTLLQVFDNRVFFSGNQNYPNTVWHCSLNNPSYCSDLDYYNEGLDLSPVTGMVAGNNALWVFKEPSQANTTVFYHNPTIDSAYGKVYPSTHSSISTGCIGGAINFNDDICFFSDRGMEAINGDVTTEQVLAHRSSLIDSKLLGEANYKDMILEEWKGYLLVFIDNHVYLADSNADYSNSARYDWFYWEMDKKITCTRVKDETLYLCAEDGIYTLEYDEDYTEVTFTEEDGKYVLYGESTQEVRSGKNLWNNENYSTSTTTIVKTETGFNFNRNGIIGGHNVFNKIPVKANTTYTFSMSKEGDTDVSVYIYADQVYGSLLASGVNSVSYTPTEDAELIFAVIIASNVNNVSVSDIQVEANEIATEYEKYGVSPSPDYPSEIVNTYKAGKYKATIDGKEYRFILTDDLRSAGEYKDKLLFSNDKLLLEKNIKERVLGEAVTFYSGNLFNTLCRYGTYTMSDAKSLSRNYNFISNKISPANEKYLEYGGYLNELNFIILTDYEDTEDNFNSKVSDAIIYYPLANVETTEIDYRVSPLSYWTTPLDEFNNPQYQKTTNKRGCVTDMKGTSITISTRINDEEFEDIVTHENITSYVVNRIKKKKWKAIQLRFSSNKPFELFSCTLESYVGGYIKR
jgi:hypothetical protein